MVSGISITIALLCVFFAGIIAAGESSLARISRREVGRWVEQGKKRAHSVDKALLHPAPVLNVAVFLRHLLEALAIALVGSVVFTAVHNLALAVPLTALAMGVIVFVGVGVSPRTIGRRFPEVIAPAVIPPLLAITMFLGPVARLLVLMTNSLTPGKGFKEGPFVSEVELRDMVDMASDTQSIDAGERRMVQAVFELGDTLVREVMVPRTDIVAISTGTSLDRAMRLFIRSGFSRVPVIRESRDNILGMLFFKDVVRNIHGPGDTAKVVDDVMRPASLVPDTLTVERLMEQMQNEASHVSVLIDEYGGVAGLVTMEDLVEEIVGEISDEHDDVVDDIEEIGDGVYRVRAGATLNDLATFLDTDIDDDEVDTVGGLLAKAIGKVPLPGAEATTHGLHVVAERLEGRRKRLATLIVTRVHDAPAMEEVRGEDS